MDLREVARHALLVIEMLLTASLLASHLLLSSSILIFVDKTSPVIVDLSFLCALISWTVYQILFFPSSLDVN